MNVFKVAKITLAVSVSVLLLAGCAGNASGSSGSSESSATQTSSSVPAAPTSSAKPSLAGCDIWLTFESSFIDARPSVDAYVTEQANSPSGEPSYALFLAKKDVQRQLTVVEIFAKNENVAGNGNALSQAASNLATEVGALLAALAPNDAFPVINQNALIAAEDASIALCK